MRVVGVRLLKNRLSEYLRLAASGETILVTDRDRVVAELSPPRPDRPPEPETAVIADLARRGLVRLGERRRGPLPPRQGPPLRLEEMLRGLDKDREDRP